ncbi:MAG: hypothetical protein OES57_09080 [Acidimicrobiia bacterium]|nr:hypothetical protein [Acidimicrobiia bacterium]
MTLDDSHQWLSFDDSAGNTWMFDVTFLTSNWSCVWDRGCPGIGDAPAPERQEGCCSYGAHLADDADGERVVAAARRLRAEHWQHHRPIGDASAVIGADADGDAVTVLADDACVFLNRPGFEGGAGCALHQGALAAGERPLDWKPEVCWQLPLRLEFHDDDNDHTTFTLREWKQRDWGTGGDEFHWWCTADDLAFVDVEPVYRTLVDELAELVGREVYDRLVEHLDQLRPEHILAHPVLRKR